MKPPTLGHRFQYGLYRTFEFLLARLPIGSTFRLGGAIGKLAFPCAAPLKRTVMRNLNFAFGETKSKSELRQLARSVFVHTAGNLFASIRIPFLSEKKIRQCVTISNLEILEQAVAKNKGTVLLIPHMGNWELLAQSPSLAQVKVPFATHYRPLNNPLLNQLIERRRKKRGVKLFPKRTSSHTLCSFLRENGILGILADQRIPSRGEICAFFGRPTICSPLPALLAKRTEAEIIGLHCRTLSPGQWELTFTKTQGRDSQACATNLEAAWRTSPQDVFWFQDRWKLIKKFPLSPFTRPPYPAEDLITKPLRLLYQDPNQEPLALPFPDYLVEQYHQSNFQSSRDFDLIIPGPDFSLFPTSNQPQK